MSLVIRNAQRSVPLRRAPLRRALSALLAALGASRFDVALVCAGDGLMRRLNGAYRQRPEPTDVLSFPAHRLAPGQLPRPRCRHEYHLGDVFLGVEYIARHAAGEDLQGVLTVSPDGTAREHPSHPPAKAGVQPSLEYLRIRRRHSPSQCSLTVKKFSRFATQVCNISPLFPRR